MQTQRPSRCWIRAGLVLSLLALATLTGGCRDLLTDGRRFSSEDLLEGRPPERGGPSLTDAERRRGWVAIESSDLSEFEDALRERLQLEVRLEIDVTDDAGDQVLLGTLSPSARGDLRTYDPEAGTFGNQRVGLRTPFLRIDVGELLGELAAGCGNALTSSSLGDACFGLPSFDLGLPVNPIDGLTFRADPASIRAHWIEPEDAYNEFPRRRTAGNDPSGKDCSGDGDCEFGLVCKEGTCACDEDTRCPSGFTCDTTSERCEWDEVACTEDADCSSRPDVGVDEADCGELSTCEKRVFWSLDSDPSQQHPVLAVDVRWDVDIDPDDAVDILAFPIRVHEFSTRFRIQALPCTEPRCTNHQRVFEGFRNDAHDLFRNDHGFRYEVRAEHLDHDVEFIPVGASCWLSAGIACAILEAVGRSELEEGFIGVTRGLASLVRTLISVPAGRRYVTGARESEDLDDIEAIILREISGLGSLWASAVAPLTRVDLSESSFDPAGTRRVFAADGAFTNAFVEALAAGASIRRVAFEAEALTTLCGPDPRVSIGGDCAGGASVDGCAEICAPCVGTRLPACDFRGDAFVVPVADGTIAEDLLSLPDGPTLAALLEGLFVIGSEFRGTYGQVLADTVPSLRRFTDIAWCPVGRSGPRCPGHLAAEEDRVVLHFNPDADLDGSPDVFDLCPDDRRAGAAAEDWDGDGHGNVCDLCPLNAGANGDRDGDGVGDACDCDLDGDGCNQRLQGVAVAAPDGVDDVPVSACLPTAGLIGGLFDQDPLVSDGMQDNDGDGLTDHCDADDDNDGILDDGAGDGLGTYSPCENRETTTCDDNCSEVANADQEDRNEDGLGDACDPICNASSSFALCNPSVVGFGVDLQFDLALTLDLDDLCPSCWLRLLCESVPDPGAAGTPGWGGCLGADAGIAFGEGLRFDLANLFTVNELPFVRLADAVLVPDVDFDGLAEAAVAISGAAGGPGPRIVLLSSVDGAPLWTFDALEEAVTLASLAVEGTTLYVGAPDARKGAGAVVALDTRVGEKLASFGTPGSDGFGWSLHVNGRRLFAGAPFAAQTAGRVFVLDRHTGESLGELEGPEPGVLLGAGPIATFSRFVGGFVAIGSPAAGAGDGELLVFREEPLELVRRLPGTTDARLGAALAVLPRLGFDGDFQGWVGAPGAEDELGVLYRLTGGLELGPVIARGAEPGDRFAALLHLGGSRLFVSQVGGSLDGVERGATFVRRVEARDRDGDGVVDIFDNCVNVPNPGQLDANADADDRPDLEGRQSYGNVCDPDLAGDGRVGRRDRLIQRRCARGRPWPGFDCREADLVGDGLPSEPDPQQPVVDLLDQLHLLRWLWSPGASPGRAP